MSSRNDLVTLEDLVDEAGLLFFGLEQDAALRLRRAGIDPVDAVDAPTRTRSRSIVRRSRWPRGDAHAAMAAAAGVDLAKFEALRREWMDAKADIARRVGG